MFQVTENTELFGHEIYTQYLLNFTLFSGFGKSDVVYSFVMGNPQLQFCSKFNTQKENTEQWWCSFEGAQKTAERNPDDTGVIFTNTERETRTHTLPVPRQRNAPPSKALDVLVFPP